MIGSRKKTEGMHANAIGGLGAERLGDFCLAGPAFSGRHEMRGREELGI